MVAPFFGIVFLVCALVASAFDAGTGTCINGDGVSCVGGWTRQADALDFENEEDSTNLLQTATAMQQGALRSIKRVDSLAGRETAPAMQQAALRTVENVDNVLGLEEVGSDADDHDEEVLLQGEVKVQSDDHAEEVLLQGAVKVQSAVESAGQASLDHNGKACMLCNKPLPERLTKNYTEFRMDCGGHSSPSGPVASHFATPVAELGMPSQGSRAATNGFCELNYAKSCVDAVANEDYHYYSKSMSLKQNSAFEKRYCLLNGFLETDVLEAQKDFHRLRAKAKELCDNKYAQYKPGKISFLDMMERSRYEDESAPSLSDAEFLAAFNCGMGDLGCDMAMCAYSFCKLDGGKVGLYDECSGWDPKHGMRHP